MKMSKITKVIFSAASSKGAFLVSICLNVLLVLYIVSLVYRQTEGFQLQVSPECNEMTNIVKMLSAQYDNINNDINLKNMEINDIKQNPRSMCLKKVQASKGRYSMNACMNGGLNSDIFGKENDIRKLNKNLNELKPKLTDYKMREGKACKSILEETNTIYAKPNNATQVDTCTKIKNDYNNAIETGKKVCGIGSSIFPSDSCKGANDQITMLKSWLDLYKC
jgi:hypothetical protein